ncbi:MAG: hypothetical protein A2176_04665 [Spirochaetes bacterium RBG_13_51_14]|nr:MAG: hypothetical protein A2176_04665 [Spirochaetes bacterium RBG_13_51_14]
MTNNRKHIRLSYEKKVELIAEGHTFEGKSIDISNSGIQVVVNVPVSHLSIQRIAFKLPLASELLHIPCKIVRSKNHGSHEDGYVLGIEFAYQTEAQMILIDSFIRNMKNVQLANDRESSEMRIIPRVSCNLNRVSCDKPGVSIASIDNISADGCLISFEGKLDTNETMDIAFSLPGDKRLITVPCRVTYVINHYFRNVNRAGVFFSTVSDIDSIKIRNFIMKSASSSAIKTIQERRNENIVGDEYQIREHDKIGAIFIRLKQKKDKVNLLFEKNISMFELHLKQVSLEEQVFTTLSDREMDGLDLKKSDTAYFSFYLQGSSYYFTSELVKNSSGCLVFSFPAVLYQSEKRSYNRKFIGDGIDICLELDGSSSGRLHGKLVNVSRRGFLCNITMPHNKKDLFKSGQAVSYAFDKNVGLTSFGEIRHLKEETSPDGATILQIGIEAGIRRAEFGFRRYTPARWKGRSGRRQRPAAGVKEKITSDMVRYANSGGKEIVALLNYTREHAEGPVVILPPAFGKKKEALSPLAVTLVENFRYYGQDIVTVRYDGINRPGESYNDDMCPKRGYEMLHYRISQGLDDLEATLNFVCGNDIFRRTAVIVVAFSMSALDARKIALRDERVDYLVNVMGVTCARSAFSNTTGGIDIIGNFNIGIQNGIAGVLGHILNLDTVARDLIENKYAYLADARFDMSRIAVPVSWIYGKHDKWISQREIRDIMSVKADGDREVIEIPTGHNLRSSEDAVKTFKIITGLIYRRLHGKNIRPVDPDRDTMVNLITYERERITQADEINIVQYWKDYLIGEDRNSVGYDFYKNVDEFKAFLSLEGSLIDPKNGEIIADMGCGTGIFIERMLDDMAVRGTDLSGARLVEVDLVPEALARTREKIERLRGRYGSLIPLRVEYLQMDLEPNRLLPVKKFMADRTLGLNWLRNRIEGLKSATLDRMMLLDPEKIHGMMRGEEMSDDIYVYLKEHLSEDEIRAVVEFNRASRFIAGTITAQDLKVSAAANGGKVRPDALKLMTVKDLDFKELNFGAKGLALNLNFGDNCFDKVAASLLVSYLFNPDEIILEFHRLLKPGGRLLVSSMVPDSDISGIFTNYIKKIHTDNLEKMDESEKEKNLIGARLMLNEAAALFELEEDGYFRFYTGDELAAMLKTAGFEDIRISPSLGDPPQAAIVTGIKPDDAH